MIKFFRTIRQNLLSEGKIGKYLKYATGETVLIVIGILIALSIDNWNEDRKLQNEGKRYLKDVSDFIYIRAENIFSQYYLLQNDSILNSFLIKDSIAFKNLPRSWAKNPLSFIENSEWEWDKSLDIVLENQKLYPESFNKIISILREMKTVQEGYIIPYANTLLDMSQKNKEVMSTSFEWYPYDDVASNKKRNAYYFTDYQFYNRLYDFKENYDKWSGQYLRLRALKISLWIELNLMNFLDNKMTLLEGLEKFSMNELEEINCETAEEPEKSIHDFLIWSIIFNNSNDTLYYTRSDRMLYGEYNKEYLLPRSITLLSTKQNKYIMILENEQCSKLIKTEINGYWIND